MRRLTLGVLLLLLFGIATVGTAVVVFLLTTLEIRSGAIFRISFLSLLLAGGLSTAYGLLQIMGSRERVTPLPTLFTFGTAAFVYDLFAVTAALLAWKVVTFSTRGYLALHAGGLTVFLMLWGVAAMIATRAREELDDKAHRQRLFFRTESVEEAAGKLADHPELAARVASLAEALRYSDPVSTPAVRDEESALESTLAALGANAAALAFVAPEDRAKLLESIALGAEQAQELLKRRNAKLLATK